MDGHEMSHSVRHTGKKKKKEKFTALLHQITVDALEERASSRT